ncbi:LysR family transcriptional regulator [Achromobacter sp. NPDC058515]|uniref:LysR family transcriptional regulator n=1 Tax=Achromobacter sp. NPDC058515 TaxID=3346533 RepID=UPI00364F7C0D
MKPTPPTPPSRDIDPVSLRLFLAALEEGSLARAAARENIVPSAVSKRMSEMEEAFGVLLLARGVKGVQPTPAGSALAAHVRRVLQDMDRMHRDMAGFATGVRGRIRLAVSVAALSGELPAQIQSFRRSYPQIDISLEEDTTQAAFRAVLEGQADVAAGSDFGHDGLQVFPCGHCELAAVVPGQHLLADRETLDYAQLLPFEQIELNRDNGISSVFEQAARDAGMTRRISARVSSHETICMLVARGMGVAVVPHYLKPRHAHLDIRFIPLAGPWSSTPICIAVRDPEALSPAARALLAHLGVLPAAQP